MILKLRGKPVATLSSYSRLSPLKTKIHVPYARLVVDLLQDALEEDETFRSVVFEVWDSLDEDLIGKYQFSKGVMGGGPVIIAITNATFVRIDSNGEDDE